MSDIAELAQRQLERYNAHDLDGFVACYHPEVEVFDWPDARVLQGREALRARYATMLVPGSTVVAQVSQRIVHGSVAIDHEHVTGHPQLGERSLVVVYEAEGGLIRRVRFLR